MNELAKVYKANKDAGITNETASDIENPVKCEALADKFLLIGLGIADIVFGFQQHAVVERQPADITFEISVFHSLMC